MADVERGGQIIREVEVKHLGYEAPEMGMSFWSRVMTLQPPWYWVRDWRKRKEMRVILKDVSFKVTSGQVMAIMGGSGSGKTSLLDIIGRRTSSNTKITGTVLFDGCKSTVDVVTSCVAYVRQDDRLLQNLTVRETLNFVAHLKMDRKMSNEDINKRVDSVLWELGLYHVADTKVGGVDVRGVSGGERRRVSIGFQLLQNPSVLLLDEPTSGLDSFTAHHLVETLQILARHGRVVILSIHQPRSDIFALFDQLMLLSQGSTVYLGDPTQIVTYFTGAGYPCPSLTNPGDFYVDLTTVDPSSDSTVEESVRTIEKLKQHYEQQSKSEEGATGISRCSTSTSLNSLSGQSAIGSQVALLSDSMGSSGASMPKQFWILLRRAFANKVEDYWVLGIQALQALAMSVMIGLVFFQMKTDQLGIRDRFGMLYIIGALYPYMVVMDVIHYYHQERNVLYNEIQDGLYSYLPYFLAKLLSEVPEHTLFIVLYTLPVYLLSGLQPKAHLYFQMFAVVYLVVYCSRSLALLWAAALPTYQLSTLCTQLFFTFFLLATGYIFNLNSIFVGVKWLTSVSYLKHGYQSLAKIEMPGLTFSCSVPIPGLCIHNGTEALKEFALADGEIWHGPLIIIGQICLFQIIFFIAMRFISQKPHES